MPSRRIIEVVRPAPRRDRREDARADWVLACELVESRWRGWCGLPDELKDDMALSVLAALDQEQAAAERLEAAA